MQSNLVNLPQEVLSQQGVQEILSENFRIKGIVDLLIWLHGLDIRISKLSSGNAYSQYQKYHQLLEGFSKWTCNAPTASVLVTYLYSEFTLLGKQYWMMGSASQKHFDYQQLKKHFKIFLVSLSMKKAIFLLELFFKKQGQSERIRMMKLYQKYRFAMCGVLKHRDSTLELVSSLNPKRGKGRRIILNKVEHWNNERMKSMVLLVVNNYLTDCNEMHRNDIDTNYLKKRIRIYRKGIRQLFWDALDFKIPMSPPVLRPLKMFGLLNQPVEVIELD